MECNLWDTGWETFLCIAKYVPKHLFKHDPNTIQAGTVEERLALLILGRIVATESRDVPKSAEVISRVKATMGRKLHFKIEGNTACGYSDACQGCMGQNRPRKNS